jgi:hypothetical protein
MGVYTLVFPIPPVSYTIDSEIISVPVVSFIHTKRDIGLPPPPSSDTGPTTRPRIMGINQPVLKTIRSCKRKP